MIPPVLTVPPDGLPVTLAEAKAHCRIDTTDEDSLITSFIGAAVAHLDGYSGVLGRCLLTQTWRQDFVMWSRTMRLPFPDVSEAVVTYYDASGVEQTVASSLYDVLGDSRGSHICFRNAFTSPALEDDRPRPVSITLTAGFGLAAAVPEDLKSLIRQMVNHWHWYRPTSVDHAMQDVPLTYQAVVAKYRRVAL